jgi:hypothetical protein
MLFVEATKGSACNPFGPDSATTTPPPPPALGMEAEDIPSPHLSPCAPYARVEYVPTAAWSTLTNTNAFDDTRV